MLIRMDIINFALIDYAIFEPQSGFTVITGETGAGKSLLIDAISALRGEKMGKDAVRTGCKKASVEAIFDRVSHVCGTEELANAGIPAELDDTIVISREISSDGKSICRINGKIMPLSLLKDIGSRFVDIHGQNDQQAIFRPSMHLLLLDRFGGLKIQDAVQSYVLTLASYRDCIERIRLLGSDPVKQKQRSELLQFQMSEIENANFSVGDEEALLEQKRVLSNYDKIRLGIYGVLAQISRDDDAAPISLLYGSSSSFDSLLRYDLSLRPIYDQYVSALAVLDGVKEDLDTYLDHLALPSISLTDVENRLDLLFRLKIKYGATIPLILSYKSEVEKELQMIKENEAALLDSHKQRLILEKELIDKADTIHNERVTFSHLLCESIKRELADLGMPGATFSVMFSQRPRDRFFSKNGYDEVSFMMSANRGEEEKPLAKIASGGEASRIMLAIKTILASADDTDTLIFDEIDTGISGHTATVVAQKIQLLSRSHQVLCVTHMAQIAAAADRHFVISKNTVEDRTQTSIAELTDAERAPEVARLLSGERLDQKSLDLARQLLMRKGTL